jgi:hypothetical protein
MIVVQLIIIYQRIVSSLPSDKEKAHYGHQRCHHQQGVFKNLKSNKNEMKKIGRVNFEGIE